MIDAIYYIARGLGFAFIFVSAVLMIVAVIAYGYEYAVRPLMRRVPDPLWRCVGLAFKWAVTALVAIFALAFLYLLGGGPPL